MDSNIVLRHEMLRSEKIRLATFTDWNLPINPRLMAAAGFYKSGNGSEASCFSCELMFLEWGNSPLPMQDHITVAPECPFVRGLDKSIPIDETDVEPLTVEQIDDISKSVPDRSLIKTFNGLMSRSYRTIFLFTSIVLLSIPKPDTIGGLLNVEAFYEMMKLPACRYFSFKRHHGTTFYEKPIGELVDAGLFCLSNITSLQCFSCRCIMGKWHRNHSAIERHKKLSPHCPHVLSLVNVNQEAIHARDIACKICLVSPSTHATVPCGHLICVACLSKIGFKCPQCRTEFHSTLRLYI